MLGLQGFYQAPDDGKWLMGYKTQYTVFLLGGIGRGAETSFLDGRQSEAEFDRLQAALGHPGRFAAVLRRDAVGIECDPKSISHWFAALARRYRICNNDTLPAFAVDIAFYLPQTAQKYRDKLPTLLGHLMKKPLLLRGARFAALVAVSTGDQCAGKSGR